MEVNVVGDPDKPQTITTEHLKRAILEIENLIKNGHEILGVKFINKKDSAVVIVLTYEVKGDLIIEHHEKKDNAQ